MAEEILEVIYKAPILPSGYDQWKESILNIGRNKEIFRERMKTRHATVGNGDRKTGSGIIHGGRGLPMEIDAQSPNWSTDGKPKCFNCNKYGHIGKDCKEPKKKRFGTSGGQKKFGTPTSGGTKDFECFKCGIKGHYAKNCRKPKKDKGKQRAVETNSDADDKMEESEEEQGFPKGSD